MMNCYESRMIEEDFIQFRKGINPELLFESFEALIMKIQKGHDETDELIDHLASVYRYILSGRSQQLVVIDEELAILNELVQLFNHLPYRNVSLRNKIQSGFLVVPGSLLTITEHIIRRTIHDHNTPLEVGISENNGNITLQYIHNDRITDPLTLETLKGIKHVYGIYSNNSISIEDKGPTRTISIPGLQTDSDI